MRQKHGVQFMVARAYRSIGSVDPTAMTNLANAKTAGIQNRSVYFFPDIRVGANSSVDVFHSAARSWTSFDRVWIDIEGVFGMTL